MYSFSVASLDRIAVVLLVVWVAITGARVYGAEQPLLEREPFDRITLDAENKNAVLEVAPLDLPGRRLPQAPDPDEKLFIRLLDRPEKRYKVRWGAIEHVELFEQMLLAEAGRLTGEGRLEEAYEYFARLQRDYPDLPELSAAIEAYLYEDAKAAFRSADFHRALAMLWEIYQRNPQRPGLDKALGVATDRVVQQYVGEQKFPESRTLTRRLERAFPGHPVAAAWHQRWSEEAAALLAQARAHLEAQRLAEASVACRRMVRIWPQLPGARELAAEVHEQYPRVVVGVARPVRVVSIGGSLRAAYAGLDDPAGRRARRLLYRMLVEMVAAGRQGGTYVCPPGELSADAPDGTLTLKINPGVGWAEGHSTLSAHDVARRIAELARRETSGAGRAWRVVLGEAEVRSVLEMELRLRHALPQPEGLLRITVPPYAEPELAREEPPVPNGPYQMAAAGSGRTVFVANPRYVLRGEAGGPKEVVEQYVPDVHTALRMLRAGELDVLARVPPRLVPRLEREADIAVGPYAVPSIHCLVPNPRGPLPACPTLRRAVVYGIHRSAILNRLLRGARIAGCRPAGGPFAAGEGTNIAGAYAADPQIEPRPYDPQTASPTIRKPPGCSCRQRSGRWPAHKLARRAMHPAMHPAMHRDNAASRWPIPRMRWRARRASRFSGSSGWWVLKWS